MISKIMISKIMASKVRVSKVRVSKFIRGLTSSGSHCPVVGTAVSLGCVLGMITGSPVWAGYTPPEGDPPRGSTIANSTRGSCQTGTQPLLTPLAPTSHVGQSSTTSPTLSWYVSTSHLHRIEVSLYSIDKTHETPQLIYLFEEVRSQSGLHAQTLPPAEISLQAGERYLWQVAIACDPESPSYDQAIVAELEIVTPPDALVAKVEQLNDTEKAMVYAESGYWYDALRDATDSQVRSLLKELAALETGDQRQVLEQIAQQPSLDTTSDAIN